MLNSRWSLNRAVKICTPTLMSPIEAFRLNVSLNCSIYRFLNASFAPTISPPPLLNDRQTLVADKFRSCHVGIIGEAPASRKRQFRNTRLRFHTDIALSCDIGTLVEANVLDKLLLVKDIHQLLNCDLLKENPVMFQENEIRRIDLCNQMREASAQSKPAHS